MFIQECKFPATSGNKLNILFFNARGLKGKLNDLSIFIASNAIKFDIIILNETWLTEHDKPLINLPDFTSYHSVRKSMPEVFQSLSGLNSLCQMN